MSRLQPEPLAALRFKLTTHDDGTDFQLKDFVFRNTAASNLFVLRKREVLFSQNSLADAAFYLQDGRIKLRAASPAGHQATVALLGPGDLLGEECLDPKTSFRPTAAVAVSDCSVIRLDRFVLEQLLREDLGFQELFLGLLFSRQRRMQQNLMATLCLSGEKRLAYALLLIAGLATSSLEEKVVPRINQDELAEVVGTTRARVSFFMNRFREQGYIDYNGELTVRRSLLEIIAAK